MSEAAVGKTEEALILAGEEMSNPRIGFRACVDAIGRDFYRANRDRSVFAHGDGLDESLGLWCFVGVNTFDIEYDHLRLTADMDEEWEYYASCYVKDGVATMDRCRTPEVSEERA